MFGNLERGTFGIGEFYRRRIRRIFPALITVLLACAVFGWLVLLTDEFQRLGRHIAASSIFVQNFVLWGDSGYFDTDARSKPLLHLWSLAIEEQFYIFWPLLLAAIWRRKWSFFPITAALALVSFIANAYLAENDPTADFYSPLSRFWELMVGGLLAYVVLHRPAALEKYADARSVLGFACIGVGTIFIDKTSAFPGWWALLPTLGAFLIISAGPTAALNRYLLANRAMVGLGLISYPLYLWHWPILSFKYILRPHADSMAMTLALVALAVLSATATYYLIERPFRTSTRRYGPPILATAMSALLVAGALIARVRIEPRLYDTGFTIPSKTEWDFLKTRVAHFDPNGTGIYRLHSERKSLTLFIGDSHVAQYAERAYQVADRDPKLNGSIFAVGGGCPPIRNVFTDDRTRRSCWRNRDEGLALARDPRVTNVVLGASWYWYFDDSYDSGYYYLRGARVALRTQLGRSLALNELRDEIVELKRSGKHVYLLVGDPIETDFDPHVYFDRFARVAPVPKDHFATLDTSELRTRTRILSFARRIGTTLIDPYPTLCDEDRCRRISESGVAIFEDDAHFNPDWALDHADFIDVALTLARTNVATKRYARTEPSRTTTASRRKTSSPLSERLCRNRNLRRERK